MVRIMAREELLEEIRKKEKKLLETEGVIDGIKEILKGEFDLEKLNKQAGVPAPEFVKGRWSLAKEIKEEIKKLIAQGGK